MRSFYPFEYIKLFLSHSHSPMNTICLPCVRSRMKSHLQLNMPCLPQVILASECCVGDFNDVHSSSIQ